MNKNIPRKTISLPGQQRPLQPQQQQFQRLTFMDLNVIKVIYTNNNLWNEIYTTDEKLSAGEKEYAHYHDDIKLSMIPQIGQVDILKGVGGSDKMLLTLKDNDILSYHYVYYDENYDKPKEIIMTVRC